MRYEVAGYGGTQRVMKQGAIYFNIFLNDMFYFIEALCQTCYGTDDNSLASGVVIQWFKERFMKANASMFPALCAIKAAYCW